MKLVQRLFGRPNRETQSERAKRTAASYDESHSAEGHIVLSYSNVSDCLRWGLKPIAHTPWHWASNWVLEMARPTSGNRLLDLGCISNPYILGHCARHDIDAWFVDIASRPSDVDFPKSTKFVQSDLTRPLPFAEESFDVVLSESTLEHLPAEERLFAFQEAVRCLRPGGRLAISIGLPLGFGDDPETAHALETHEFFTRRHCCVYFPVDVRMIVDQIGGCELYPHNRSVFPGFDQYTEENILGDPNIVFDRYQDHAEVPDVAKLLSVSVVEIGIFLHKPLRPQSYAVSVKPTCGT